MPELKDWDGQWDLDGSCLGQVRPELLRGLKNQLRELGLLMVVDFQPIGRQSLSTRCLADRLPMSRKVPMNEFEDAAISLRQLKAEIFC